jgi:hypothetical protein
MPTTTIGRNAVGLRGTATLMVRIGRGAAIRSVSVPLPEDAQITWSAPGGDDTFSATIPWPDRGIARPDAFTQNMPLRVEDRRTGEIIWQGRVSDPGFTGDRAQQEFRVSAVGAGHDLDMISVVKLYVDRDPERWVDMHTWQAGPVTTGDGTGFIASIYDALQIPPEYYLEMPWPQGLTMNTSALQKISYLIGYYASLDMLTDDASTLSRGPNYAIPEVHGIRFSWISAFANANSVKVTAGAPEPGSNTDLWSAAFTAGGQHDVDIRETTIGPPWARDDFTHFNIYQQRTGAAAASGSDNYVRFANIHVLGKRYNKYGVDITDSRNEFLCPYEIVEDMLGTILNGKFDPGGIWRDTDVLIDQAAYWQPTSVSDILDEADGWNPDTWWGVSAPLNPDSLPRLEYRTWNLPPRYTLDDTAHVELEGGAEMWANSALITYLRGNGTPTITRASISVPILARLFGTTGSNTTAKNTRDISVDITDRGPMVRQKAVEIVTAQLAAAATEKVSGSATVRGAIMDDAYVRLAQPWEIRPGWPILVGATPNQFNSGATGPVYDGESTFRLSRVTYSASDDSAALEFDGGNRRLSRVRTGSGRRFTATSWEARVRARRRRPRRRRR